MNLLYVNRGFFVKKNVLQNKKINLVRKCFYISANLFNVWLNRRQQDSPISLCS